MCVPAQRNRSSTWENQFPPFPMWVLRIESKFSIKILYHRSYLISSKVHFIYAINFEAKICNIWT